MELWLLADPLGCRALYVVTCDIGYAQRGSSAQGACYVCTAQTMLNEGVVDFRAEFGAVTVGLSLLGSTRTQRNSPHRMRRKQMELEEEELP